MRKKWMICTQYDAFGVENLELCSAKTYEHNLLKRAATVERSENHRN